AYVSRGLLRSEGNEGQRERRYRAEDVSRLKRQRDVGRKAEAIAANALDFGTPVLESSLTLIKDGRLYYRGFDATRLARNSSLEQAAQLLWECDDRPFAAGNLPAMSESLRRAWHAAETLSAADACLVLLPAAARWDHSSWIDDRGSMLETAARILRLLTAGVTHQPPADRPIHEQLAEAWHCSRDDARLIRAALVLSADHEFNASAFAARVVASTGANLYASTMAGLAAITGPRHGGLTRLVRTLFDELAETDELRGALAKRLGEGPALPGFGHPLYPDGDVRAVTLFEMMREALPRSSELARAEQIAEAGEALTNRQPNIDFATVTLERALGLPKDAALSIFLLGRTVGWIGHALEQAATGTLIRPRARYTGPQPQD
ncbi:MAG TPA: citrate synthase, partial [Reyranella sp.]|nr:citrate synthase [Reyranella sp.]